MNGDGTKDNPYQVTTVAEFYEATRYDSESTLLECQKYIKLMNDIDFNDYEYWNLSNHNMIFKEIDGQGHVIKNIYFKNLCLFVVRGNKGSTGINFEKTIKNVVFEFIKFDSQSPPYDSATNSVGSFLYLMSNYYYCYLINCEFRGKIFNSYNSSRDTPVIYMGEKWKMINCVFNIDYYDNGYANNSILVYLTPDSSAPCYIENCEFNVNFYTCKNSLNSPWLFDKGNYGNGYISNISIFLNLICSHDIQDGGNNKLYIFGNGINLYVNNSSFVIRNKGPKIFPRLMFCYSTSSMKSLCIYDKDIIGETYTDAASYSLLQGLTTEQMKDPEYLNSIGFPII